VVTAHSLPRQLVRLEADGALVGDLGDLGDLGEAGGGVEDADAEPCNHLGPDAIDAPAELLDEVGGEPRNRLELDEVDAMKEKAYLVASRLGVSEAHVGDVGGDATCDMNGTTGETNGTTGSGNLTATLDGGGGEHGGGVRGEVGHADRRYAITVTDTPPTTRSTHGGRATTLDIVLAVPSVITLPNKVGDVRGSGEYAGAGAEHLFILRVHMTWVTLGQLFGERPFF